MNPFLKDVIQVVSWLVAVIGGLTAAVVAIRQLQSNTKQRKDEFRWRQANAAKEIISDIHNNNWAKNAVTMLDWNEGKRRFKFENEKDSIEISYDKDVLPALKREQSECSDLEKNIVYCFDWFFYFINRIEHYVNTKLIAFEDVADICTLYGEKIRKHEEFETFMSVHGYNLASDFWKHAEDNKRLQRKRR